MERDGIRTKDEENDAQSALAETTPTKSIVAESTATASSPASEEEEDDDGGQTCQRASSERAGAQAHWQRTADDEESDGGSGLAGASPHRLMANYAAAATAYEMELKKNADGKALFQKLATLQAHIQQHFTMDLLLPLLAQFTPWGQVAFALHMASAVPESARILEGVFKTVRGEGRGAASLVAEVALDAYVHKKALPALEGYTEKVLSDAVRQYANLEKSIEHFNQSGSGPPLPLPDKAQYWKQKEHTGRFVSDTAQYTGHKEYQIFSEGQLKQTPIIGKTVRVSPDGALQYEPSRALQQERQVRGKF